MPHTRSNSSRIHLRLRPEVKTTLARAAMLECVDLTGYILRHMLPQAEATISPHERLQLSERDSLRILALLENPPAASASLARAAKAGIALK